MNDWFFNIFTHTEGKHARREDWFLPLLAFFFILAFAAIIVGASFL